MITRRERAWVEGESRIIVLRAAHMRAGLLHLLLRCLPFQPQVFSHTCSDTETSFDERNVICRGLEVKFLLWMSILAKFWLRLKKKKKKKKLNISHGFSHELSLCVALGNFCTYHSGGNDQHLYSISDLKTWLILLCITAALNMLKQMKNNPPALTNCLSFFPPECVLDDVLIQMCLHLCKK